MQCTFCDSDLGVTEEKDNKGNVYHCCGWCWAHVIKAIMPDDVTKIIEMTRRWLQGESTK